VSSEPEENFQQILFVWLLCFLFFFLFHWYLIWVKKQNIWKYELNIFGRFENYSLRLKPFHCLGFSWRDVIIFLKTEFQVSRKIAENIICTNPDQNCAMRKKELLLHNSILIRTFGERLKNQHHFCQRTFSALSRDERLPTRPSKRKLFPNLKQDNSYF